MYTKRVDREQLVVGVYVDDLMITGSNCNDIGGLKSEMAKVFNMSDLGLLHYYLGIEVKQSSEGISLSQIAYASKIVEKCGLVGCNPSPASMGLASSSTIRVRKHQWIRHCIEASWVAYGTWSIPDLILGL
jgi:hypothetical protein